MERHVSGRHVQISDEFRRHVDERIDRLEPLVSKERRADVVVRKDGRAQDGVLVEITLHGTSPVIRAEASDGDKTVAFDRAFAKLDDRIKKAHERRRSGRRRVVTALPPDLLATPPSVPGETAAAPAGEPAVAGGLEQAEDLGPEVVEIEDSPIEVRVKRHQAAPMSLEQAVYEMEMVGHDFYLFTDAESGLPSVMYRRRGWSYGVLHLEPAPAEQG